MVKFSCQQSLQRKEKRFNMKVEFWTNEVTGLELFVKGSEFYKAKNDEREFESLEDAITAYCYHFCFYSPFDREDYEKILSLLRKSDIVIFDANLDDSYKPLLNIYLLRNDIRLKIVEI